MASTITSFKSKLAPCGRFVDGESYQDQDEQGLLTNDLYYACGCRGIHREYHDGSVCRKVVDHDGAVLVDELLAERPV